jgi:hypothetical protein
VTETLLASIPIGPVVAGEIYTLALYGDLTNNSGASVNYTFRLRLAGVAGTLIVATAALAQAASANPHPWFAEIQILPVTPASANDFTASLKIGAAVTPVTTMGAPSELIAVNPSALALNVATSLTWTVQLGTANANANARLMGAALRKGI